MFEKDAVEYREKGKNEGYYQVTQDMEQEALDYIIDESFKDGAEFGYNKANEWHYVKDGDLPKKTDEYLVYRINGYGCRTIELIQYNSSRHFWCVDCQNEVIAWKKIELPKEMEEWQKNL